MRMTWGRASRAMRLAISICLLTGGLAIAGATALAGAAAASTTPKTTFTVRGSVGQVYATGLAPHARVTLLNHLGTRVATARADGLGGVLFRNVVADRGYRLRVGATRSAPLTVLADRSAPPSTKIYDQALPTSGYGYLTTRDGTQLAIDVRLPIGAGAPPYPTLVEYAGYGYADPYHGPDSGIAEIANALGFAVVDVNMRGTGCSGGAFDFFDPPQILDGYDVIETVARQPWVLGHRVGMLGISYGGISQLFVGSTDPPHLAGITPLSVIDNSDETLLYAGGILNTGFTIPWVKERIHDARPASSTGGQPWALERINQGDKTCKANQVLHGEAANLIAKIRRNPYYVPSIVDPIAPITFVHKIHTPTYLACQWTDEQTGGHCADLAEHFTGTRHKWFTFDNGDHIDSLDPVTLGRMFDFLELYVAHQKPTLPPIAQAFGPQIWIAAMGISGLNFPADPIQAEPSYSAALAAFQAIKPIRVLFDNGAGIAGRPFVPVPAFEHYFSRFPVPGTHARSWYLAPHGALTARKPTHSGAGTFNWKPHARPLTTFSGSDGPGGLWGTSPGYNWTENPPGTALSYLTAPLRSNTVVIGAGALHLWIKASVPDLDLQVTVSEVRPDGMETFVQNGWLRTSVRKLDPRRSTLLEPVLSFRRADVAPLPRGRFTEVTIPLYYEGHAYRKDSRIRIIISAPNGDQPIWSFSQTRPHGKARVSVAFSPGMPSRLILPVVAGVSTPTGLPPCPSLRGEPCRTYRALAGS